MNRLAVTARPVLARSFATSAVRAGGLPQKEQWILDWKDPVPGKHVNQMMSDNCGRKAGIWNYWAVGAIKYGWAGTLLGEIKFIALITAAFCLPWWLARNGMIKKYGPPVLEEGLSRDPNRAA